MGLDMPQWFLLHFISQYDAIITKLPWAKGSNKETRVKMPTLDAQRHLMEPSRRTEVVVEELTHRVGIAGQKQEAVRGRRIAALHSPTSAPGRETLMLAHPFKPKWGTGD
jgi:hypothetical protein